MTARRALPRLYLSWHTAPIFAPDDAELDILADVLGGGKTSRLYKSLVRQKQIAQDADAMQESQEIAGGFIVTATARPGHQLPELEKAIGEEIKRLQSEPPSAEEIAQSV